MSQNITVAEDNLFRLFCDSIKCAYVKCDRITDTASPGTSNARYILHIRNATQIDINFIHKAAKEYGHYSLTIVNEG